MTDTIEIYVDGSWLTPGKHNPSAAGGWGAVIVASGPAGVATRFLSGSADAECRSNVNAEWLGVVSALRDVKGREALVGNPRVTLYTDQDWIVYTAASKNDGLPEAGSPAARTLAALTGDMDVTIAYMTDPKAQTKGRPDALPLMSVAHHLASAMAWMARLEKQGYIHQHHIGRLEGPEAMRLLSSRVALLAPGRDR